MKPPHPVQSAEQPHPQPAARPRLGVITNPHSGRNRHAAGAVQALLAARPDVLHVVTDSADAIDTALARFAAAGIDTVAINGGDGSVAHALRAIYVNGPFAEPPLLCALPGGTTNVTVNDVGIRGGLLPALLKLLAWTRSAGAPGSILTRPVIRLDGADGGTLSCGLVFGAGAVVDGIEYWRDQVRARGMRSEFSSGVAMLRTLWGMLAGHSGFANPVRARLDCDTGGGAPEHDYLLLVVTTLERLFLGIHPFWGERAGALRLTAIEHGARGFASALPSILRGRPLPRCTPAAGYHSERFDAATLVFAGSYTMDGELHRIAPTQSPVRVHCGGLARFLRL